jgi:NTE family protein
MKVLLLLLTALFFIGNFLPEAVQAADMQENEIPQRPKIGLVLSGGGARGAAHIGVIKILEEMRIPIDYIAGTSMGAIVGGLYASGRSVDDLEKLLTGIDWHDASKDWIPREDRSFRRKSDDNFYLVKLKPGLSDKGEIKTPSGLLQGQKIDLIFKRQTVPVADIRDFDHLSIPFRAVACDITTGETVVIGSGDLAMAMRASMSVPAAFAPVKIEGRLLVDGGVSNNLPVDVVREMGADVVIAVDISTPLLERKALASALKITEQLSGFLTRRNTEMQIASLTDQDILIEPDLGNIASGSFDKAAEAIPKGTSAANEKRQELARFSLPEKMYAAYLSGRLQPDRKEPVIEFIRLDNKSQLSDEVLLSRIRVEEGQPLNVTALEDNIGKIYGLELFENISYEIVKEDGQTGLVIHARERSWGPNYLQFGFAMAGSLDGDNSINIAVAYSRTAINRLGGEWRTTLQVGDSPSIGSEIYQPLDVNSRYFINPQLFIGNTNVNLFSASGDKLAEYQLKRYFIDISAGREIGTWGEARLGIRRGTGDAEVQVGLAGFSDFTFDSGEYFLRISADKLDNRNFPRKGVYGKLEYIESRPDLGVDSSFDQLLFNTLAAKSWGRNTLLAGATYSETADNNAPIQNRFNLGGLFKLSGYNLDELSGQHSGLLLLGYMRRIADFNFMPTFIGGSLETGNVWEDKIDIDSDNLIFAGSLFVGIDTILGPLYIGYGLAEHNRNSFYFYFGKLF